MELVLTALELLNSIKKWIQQSWRFFNRPKLHLYLDPNEPCHTRPVVDSGGVLGFFCQVMVRNDGRQIAKNCRGRLIEVSVLNKNRQFVRHPEFVNPVVLKWAHEMDFDPKDVETDIPRPLDLCYAVQLKPGVLSFFTRKVPTGNRTDFPPGTYRVKVRVDDENANHADGSFIIKYTGVWNQIQFSEESSWVERGEDLENSLYSETVPTITTATLPPPEWEGSPPAELEQQRKRSK